MELPRTLIVVWDERAGSEAMNRLSILEEEISRIRRKMPSLADRQVGSIAESSMAISFTDLHVDQLKEVHLLCEQSMGRLRMVVENDIIESVLDGTAIAAEYLEQE